LVGVPTLDAVAYQHRHSASRLLAVVEAGRGQSYAGVYRSTSRGIVLSGNLEVLSTAELVALAAAHGKVLVCGEVSRDTMEALADLPGVRLASPADSLRRPAYLAELGAARLAARGADDAAALQPLYLKRG
jgi:tRNA threonylcarbamoyladenosine biosynthesis protein TsaB